MKSYIARLGTKISLSAVLLSFGSVCLAQSPYHPGPDSEVHADVPHGETLQFELDGGKLYLGTKSTIFVYIPAQYTPDKPACLCVGLDGTIFRPQTVFDNLIAAKQMPVTIGVFVVPAAVTEAGTRDAVRYDRSYEFDSVNGTFDRFFAESILPAVEKMHAKDGRAIHISGDPNDHMIYGLSSGGICAFTAAWQHPDMFRRVFTAIGTYVGLRGGDQYPVLVRKTEPKPIRIYLQDGSADTPNASFGNWFTNNKSMEESLAFAGYDVNHYWGTLGHEGSNGEMIFPDVVRWLWRDYPAPIHAGVSGNGMLQSILVRGAEWTAVPSAGQNPSKLATTTTGDVDYVANNSSVYTLGTTGPDTHRATFSSEVLAAACGQDGSIYTAHANGRIICTDPHGKGRTVASGILASSLVVSESGNVYAAEPGIHSDLPSKIWLISPNGKKTLVDTGLHNASGLALTPDHKLAYASEKSTQWVYSYTLGATDSDLLNKQRYYWLHETEDSEDTAGGSGASQMVVDSQGNLYVASDIGVQICDRNGRVQGILSVPTGPVTSIAFGGVKLDSLYIVSGGHIYVRPIRIPGTLPFAHAIKLPGYGA